MITGSCLCGAVKYEITGELMGIINCHCNTCRKAHSAAFSSVLPVPEDNFSLTGQEHLGAFESSPGKLRHFCQNCGSQIYAKKADNHLMMVRAGSLNDDPGCKELKHIWVSDKASWYTIDSGLPQFAEFE